MNINHFETVARCVSFRFRRRPIRNRNATQRTISCDVSVGDHLLCEIVWNGEIQMTNFIIRTKQCEIKNANQIQNTTNLPRWSFERTRECCRELHRMQAQTHRWECVADDERQREQRQRAEQHQCDKLLRDDLKSGACVAKQNCNPNGSDQEAADDPRNERQTRREEQCNRNQKTNHAIQALERTNRVR